MFVFAGAAEKFCDPLNPSCACCSAACTPHKCNEDKTVHEMAHSFQILDTGLLGHCLESAYTPPVDGQLCVLDECRPSDQWANEKSRFGLGHIRDGLIGIIDESIRDQADNL